MRCSRFVSILATLAAIAVAPVTDACGDKLVMLGGGISFERITSRRPSGVVVFIAPQATDVARAQQLQQLLERAGHVVHVVRSPSELHSLLEIETADLVVGPPADIVPVADHTTEPTVLKISYADQTRGVPSEELDACLVDGTKRHGREVAATVSEMLKWRNRGAPPRCNSVL